MRRVMERNTERGFTLIELMVVVLIIAVLIGISIPLYVGFRTGAQEAGTKAELVVAAKAAAGEAADGQGFPTPAVLALAEPALDFLSGADESIHTLVDDVVASSGDRGQVLLWSKSPSGKWFGIRLIQIGPQSGRYTCEGADESDVDTLAACGLSSPW